MSACNISRTKTIPNALGPYPHYEDHTHTIMRTDLPILRVTLTICMEASVMVDVVMVLQDMLYKKEDIHNRTTTTTTTID